MELTCVQLFLVIFCSFCSQSSVICPQRHTVYTIHLTDSIFFIEHLCLNVIDESVVKFKWNVFNVKAICMFYKQFIFWMCTLCTDAMTLFTHIVIFCDISILYLMLLTGWVVTGLGVGWFGDDDFLIETLFSSKDLLTSSVILGHFPKSFLVSLAAVLVLSLSTFISQKQRLLLW